MILDHICFLWHEENYFSSSSSVLSRVMCDDAAALSQCGILCDRNGEGGCDRWSFISSRRHPTAPKYPSCWQKRAFIAPWDLRHKMKDKNVFQRTLFVEIGTLVTWLQSTLLLKIYCWDTALLGWERKGLSFANYKFNLREFGRGTLRGTL